MTLWIKALHVIAVISWMAGLLYVYRLYVYHAMESEAVVRSRFEVMERRLLNAIATPAGVVAVITGVAMIAMQMGFMKQPWMHAKLTLAALLIGSHIYAVRARLRLLTEPQAVSHKRFRFLNEVPTLLMVGIVILVIVRPWAR